MELPSNWPGPIIRVQSLTDSGTIIIPQRYVKPPSERPILDSNYTAPSINIPTFDLKGLGDATTLEGLAICSISDACKEWGAFHVVNHGVSPDLMTRMREVWKEVFHLPIEQKERYANSPGITDGYFSQYGVEEHVSIDWRDNFCLGIFPQSIRRYDRWPIILDSFRETVEEYATEVNNLSKALLKVLSLGLELDMGYLEKKMGGEAAQALMGVNFYPKCPQPELTLGISPHCDISGLTVLLDDDHVKGLQIRKGEAWLPIQHVPNSFVIFVGDMIQVISNGIYKTAEHRAVVNSEEERVSVKMVINPRGDIPITPAKELVKPDFPPLYRQITFDERKRHRLMKGVTDKSASESFLKAK